MSDVKENVSAEATEQVQETETTQDVVENNEVNETNNDDLIKSFKDRLDNMEQTQKTWEDKEKNYKTQIRSLDRKISEYTKKVKDYEQKEMTEEEKLLEERKEIALERQSLWRDQASVQDVGNITCLTEDDRNIIKTYFYGDTKEDMYDSAKSIYDILQRVYQEGEKNGSEKTLNMAHKPQASTTSSRKENDLADMEPAELANFATKVSKMESGEEKDKLLKELIKEQSRRFQ